MIASHLAALRGLVCLGLLLTSERAPGVRAVELSGYFFRTGNRPARRSR